VQDAVAAAVERWPRDGTPRDPLAWIVAVARNRAIDRLRRDRVFRARASDRATAAASATDEPPEALVPTSVPDERLRLMFACCHPALAPEAQVALTLRLLGGLSTAEVTHAFLVPEPTMAQRLARAKAKVRAARIPFRVPPDDALPARLEAVLDVVCPVFNEGYAASSGDAHVRRSLCDEAVRLAGPVAELMPDEPEALALHASTPPARSCCSKTRTAPSGTRARSSRRRPSLLARASLRGPGRYTLQAAIAVEHANAPAAAATRWDHIAAYYSHLAALRPDPMVELNRAVAIAMSGDVAGGLHRIDALAGPLDRYHYFHAARADLLRGRGDDEAAAAAYERAAELAGNDAERAFLERRLAAISARR
jgi:RNA polymerase sigma-70 factor (ECF subfamily)